MLEVLIGSTVDLLSALGRADLSWEQDSVLGNQILDLVLDLLRNFYQYIMGFRREVRMHFELRWIHDKRLIVGWILEVLNRHAQTLLCHMRTLKDHVPGLFEPLSLRSGELLLLKISAAKHELFAWDNQLLINVLDEGLDKRRANFLDSFLQPYIIV